VRVVENAEGSPSRTRRRRGVRSLPAPMYCCTHASCTTSQTSARRRSRGRRRRVARRVLVRLHQSAVADDVAFLSGTTLKWNRSPSGAIWPIRRPLRTLPAISRPALLDYLYCLTYADLSAVNKNVWTEWKASLLTDLYHRTRRVLRAKPNLSHRPKQRCRSGWSDSSRGSIARTSGLLRTPDIAPHFLRMRSPTICGR